MLRNQFRFIRTIAALSLTIVFLFAAAEAQTTDATITGRVVDGQGNVVPGAKVTATNRGTNIERSVVANSNGDYTITDLAPGRYNVSIEAPTFSRALVEDLELNVGSRQTLNIDLKPGNVTETVTVTADAPLVETTRSEIDTAITPQEIEGLPLLNRTFAGLAVIAPEARPIGTYDPTKTRVGSVAFNGGDGRQVNVNVDGGDNKDNVVGGLIQNFSYESIQEFQVSQHRWGADQGRSVGGVVNVITKSGGNSFRGSFFSNFRHDSLQTRDFLAKRDNRDKPEFQRQEYGGSLGGPIVKDKAFFFFSLERFRERQVVPIAGPPIDTNLQALSTAFPSIAFDPIIPTPYDDTLLTAKVSQNFGSKHNIYYRYSWQDNTSPNDQVLNPHSTNLSGGNVTSNKMHSFVVNHQYIFSPTVLNTFVFHVQDFVNEILPSPDGVGLTLNFPGGITIGQNANTPQSTKERKFQFRDDVSWVKGNHAMKFGANYIHTKLDGFFFFGTQGYSLTFRQTPSAIIAGGGFNRDDLLQTLQFSDGASSHLQTIDQLAFYFQDDWKITPKLTLNLGLRWDANIGNLPAQDENRTMLLLDQINHPLANALTDDQDKLSRRTPSWTEFQPRVGFAWDPYGDGKTVIRGGYGIFYDQLFQNLTLFSDVQSQPFIFQPSVNLSRPCGATVDPCNQPPWELLTVRFNGTTTGLPQPPAGFTYDTLSQGTVGRINDPDATEPYVQKWSLGFQRELSRNLSISSDYVHTLGVQEPRFLNVNPEIDGVCDPSFPGALQINNPIYAATCPRGAGTRLLDAAFVAAGFPIINGQARLGQINMFATNNRSLYDSWTTTLKYRSSKMVLNAAYVLASSRSWGGQPTASYSGNGIVITPENQFKPEEFGPTRMDERHRIVLSGVFNLPWDFQLAPIMQFATARPYSAISGIDADGDGLAGIDRLCAGVDPAAIFTLTTTDPIQSAAIRALNPRGCTQAQVNSVRNGFVPDGNGGFEERSGRFFNFDLRATKNFKFGERFGLAAYIDLYNLFNTENLSYMSRIGLTVPAATAPPGRFLREQFLFGPGFGPPVGRPFSAQIGARFTF